MFGNANTANLSADKGFSGVTPAFVAVCGAKVAGGGPTNAISRHQIWLGFYSESAVRSSTVKICGNKRASAFGG
jgi:hypothetical protein